MRRRGREQREKHKEKRILHEREYRKLHADERYAKAWGNVHRVNVTNIYRELESVANWVNNELGEECLFEVD